MRRLGTRSLAVGVVMALNLACSPGAPVVTPGYTRAPQPSESLPEARAEAPQPERGTDASSDAVPAPDAASAELTDGRVLLPEEFPSGTRSLEVTEVAHVLSAPTERAPYIGKIVGGTRVAWKRVVAPDPEPPDAKPKRRRREPCPAWVEIEPRGYLCQRLLRASSEDPKGTPQHVVRQGRLTPHDYFKVLFDETKVFKTADDVRVDLVDKVISTKVMLVGSGVLQIDETPYLRTDHGLVEAAALGRFWPSDFEGVRLSAAPELRMPFAWVVADKGARIPRVYAVPDADTKPVRKASRREVVSLLEEQGDWVRIDDGEWIERKHLRVAAITAPPAGATDAQQWVDVDLDEQVLVAYEGRTPVFATLVSTGGRKNPTPVATYRVRAKAATTPMAGDPNVPNRYEVSGVPWAVRFAGGLYIHGAYWHDGFGGARSHGCVNVAPKDASFIYQWVAPEVPDGWSEIEVRDSGVIVRVRDHENPDPPLFDYSVEE